MDEFELFSLVEPEARKHGLPVDLILRQIRQESTNRVRAVSPKGAQGLMQLMPATAASLGVTDPFDPVQNVRAGTRYLKTLYDKHKGNLPNTFAEYNGGAAAVDALRRGTPWKETRGYLAGVLPSDQAPSPVTGQPVDEFEAFTQTLTPESQGVGGPAPLPDASVAPGAIPNPQDFEMGLGERVVTEIGAGFDPTDPSGRRNIGGALGSAAATGALAGAVAGSPAAGVGAIPGAVIGGAVGMLGAAAGGAFAEAGEQLAGTKPGSGEAVGAAAGEQALYDAGGQLLMWPIKALGRRVIASSVGRNALHGLTAAREATLSRLKGALATAKDTLATTQRATDDAVHAVRERATREAEAVRGHVRGAIEGVTRTASSLVTGAKSAAEGVAEQAAAVRRGPYNALVGAPPPAPAVAGRQAQAVIEGPAKSARQQAGDAVTQAAKTGPPVNIRALKARAQAILEKEAQPVSTHFPNARPEGTGTVGEVMVGGRPFSELTPKLQAEVLAADPRLAAQLTEAGEAEAQARLRHPAMQVLHQILNAEDTVPFEAAHQFKTLLDDGLQGTQDRVLNKRVTNVTQHLRSELRQAMTGHAPYDEATARYASIIPLYTKGYAKDLRKLATDEPEAIIRLLDPKKPTKLAMLRELLTTQAAEGGDAKAGQEAFDTVLSSWTHEKVIKGGVETLGERVDKIPAEFIREMGPKGAQVFANLRTIATAYQQALSEGSLGVGKAVGAAKSMSAAAIAEARKQGGAALKSTRRLGREGIRQEELAARAQVDAAKGPVKTARADLIAAAKPTADETAFLESSIGPSQTRRPTQIAADVLHTTALGPTSIYGSLAAARLIFGPKSSDLVRWASHSSWGTQQLVKVLTSEYPGQAVADLLRASNLIERVGLTPEALRGVPPPMPSHRQGPPAPTPR